MQVSPSFDAVWKTMRRCLNGPVGFAFVAALLVVITYQLVSKPSTAQGITYALSGKAVKSATATPAATLLAQFSQQGPKLVVTDAVGNAHQGGSVSRSADGNTAILGANPQVRLTGGAETGRHSLA